MRQTRKKIIPNEVFQTLKDKHGIRYIFTYIRDVSCYVNNNQVSILRTSKAKCSVIDYVGTDKYL